MFEDSDILDAYHEAASKDETHHSLSLPPVRVLCIDGHNFIVCEIESKARASGLIVAEAFPAFGGKWQVELQTASQITVQARKFVEENQAA
jgi:hypothetical protein